jgi:hypothetical protein
LDVQPAKFTVHRHVYPQYACRPCETIVAAPAAPAVIDGGMAATGLLVWVLIGKFLDHLPLYRLAQIAARQGVPLALSTLADWVGRLGVALEPLADRLAEFRRLGNGFIVAQRFDGRTGIVGQQKDVARPTRLMRRPNASAHAATALDGNVSHLLATSGPVVPMDRHRPEVLQPKQDGEQAGKANRVRSEFGGKVSG